MNPQSSFLIFKVFGAGVCDICDAKTLRVAEDKHTGMRVGKCCVKDITKANMVLEENFKEARLRHPDKKVGNYE